jgi:succinyl-CoA synthetase alpha subunit/citrate synthase
MKQLKTKPFPYYVGVHSLEELVNKQSRVCVLNILGSESRKVTPVSHEYSGGNVVAGVQYGRAGGLETRIVEIPVFRSVRDVIKSGRHFDTGVIYLPPSAVSQAVWEVVSYNPELKRIVIVTEKVTVKDSRNIRFTCQEVGVDVIGANCLGVANAWDHVRVGGALGGDHPEEALKKGSVAIHSNSGNFTTTMAEYLKTAGLGVSTAVSSGKDVYIHYALPEFLYAAQNDPRTKAVALYVEPGGYYEKQAIEWIREKRFPFTKPIVVCVTGRWKKEIARPCGHAGAMSGSGDDAESKERWFDEYFESGAFDPANPKAGPKGVRVATLQHIPEAMRAVFERIGEKPDFERSGDLSLKLWIGDRRMPMPGHLDMPVVRAIPPYDKQIADVQKQLGAHFLRQNMRNKSGATRMNPKTQVTEVHGKTVLELSKQSFEENLYFSLARRFPEKQEIPVINALLNRFLEIRPGRMDMVRAAKADNATPNAFIASQIALIGSDPRLEAVKTAVRDVLDTVKDCGLTADARELPEEAREKAKKLFLVRRLPKSGAFCDILLEEMQGWKRKSPPRTFARLVLEYAKNQEIWPKDLDTFLMACVTAHLFWVPLEWKTVSRQTAEDAIYYFSIISQIAAFSVIQPGENDFWKQVSSGKAQDMRMPFTETLFRILFNRKPDENELAELKYLLGLTVSNGPGTLSAKGAKESVSARNAIATAFAGFMTNTGLAHGGNGYEAVEFLLEQFQDVKLADPGRIPESLRLKEMAAQAAKAYAMYKAMEKASGQTKVRPIPCINHPVFKGNDVNIDPREDFIRKELKKKGIENAFLEFYHLLVRALYDEGATPNVFCVNVDAVLAVITLKLIWNDYREEKIEKRSVQDLVFILFLLGRAVGTAAEVADHRDRGNDMDCRTPQDELSFVM